MNTKQSQMFEYYYSLGPSRSMKIVAEHFEVTERTVQRYASQFGWTTLTAQREKGVSAAIKEAGDEGAIVSALEAKRMTSDYLREAHRLFSSGKIPIKSIADIERVFKIHFDATKMEDHAGSTEASNMVSLVEALGSLANIAAPVEEDNEEMIIN